MLSQFRRRVTSATSVRGLVGLGLVLISACTATSPAGASQTAYVANSGSGTVSQYTVAAAGLEAMSTATVSAGSAPMYIAIAPNGKSAYVTNNTGGTVSQFDIAADGSLAPKATPTVLANSPRGIAVSPNGRNVYVADFGGGVSQYDVATDGSLSPKVPAELALGTTAWGVAVSPDGSSAYVTGTLGVYQYDVAADGSLAPKTPESVATRPGPRAIVVSPGGKSVYVESWGGGEMLASAINQFTVGVGGKLSPKTPDSIGTGTGGFGLTLAPDGRAAYVTIFGDSTGTGNLSNIQVFQIGADGALGSSVLVPSGKGTTDAALTPDGSSMFASAYGDKDGWQYDVAADGGLTAKTTSTFLTGTQPFGIALRPDQAPVAAFTAAPAIRGHATAFDAVASYDADGTVVRYHWDFGDGKTATTSTPTVSHAFASPRTFPVRLTVTDDLGCSVQVFTGQTASCSGRRASVVHAVRIPAPPVKVKCKVPELVGLRLAKAKKALATAHCRLGKVTKKHAKKARRGRVLKQKPKPRAVLPAGSRVAVVVGRR